MAVTLTNIRDLLASLNGEDSAPSNTSRDRFINQIIRDIYSRTQWDFRRTQTTLTFDANGQATAPAAYGADSFYDLREVVAGYQTDHVYRLTREEYKDNYYPDDEYPVWITGNDVDGYTFNIKETDSPTLTLTYFAEFVTDLSSGSDTTKIPSALAIARGAYALLKRYDDPEIDITTELAEYEAEIAKLRARYNRASGKPTRMIGPSERSGYYIGQTY